MENQFCHAAGGPAKPFRVVRIAIGLLQCVHRHCEHGVLGWSDLRTVDLRLRRGLARSRASAVPHDGDVDRWRLGLCLCRAVEPEGPHHGTSAVVQRLCPAC